MKIGVGARGTYSSEEGTREPEEGTLWGRSQQKDIPNDLKWILKSERELEEYIKCNSSENGNNLSLCFYLGSLLCKRTAP